MLHSLVLENTHFFFLKLAPILCWNSPSFHLVYLSVVFKMLCCSVAQSCPTLCNRMDCSTPGFPVLHYFPELLKLMSIESEMPFNHLILCHPLLLLPSIFPSIRVFSNGLAFCIRCSKYWSFIFSIIPSNECSGLISFMIYWFDVLAVQGTLKNLLQHHTSKASILQHPAFFIVQLSHLYMITGKTIALTIWTFVGKVMSLLFNMLSRFVIAFLPRSKRLLISWLQSPSAVILGPKKIKSVTVSIFFPIYLPWGDGTRCPDLAFWILSCKPAFFTLLFHFHQEAH